VLAHLQSRPYAVIAIGFIASYVTLDWLSYVEPFSPAGITPWSPSTGLSVALILLLGYPLHSLSGPIGGHCRRSGARVSIAAKLGDSHRRRHCGRI